MVSLYRYCKGIAPAGSFMAIPVMLGALLAGNPALGVEFAQTSLMLQHGSGYKIEHREKWLFTLEHFNKWKYGDNFLFVDVSHSDAGTSVYGEFHPRISLSRLTKSSVSFGPVKDISIAAEVEFGDDIFNYLYGLGFDLDIPAFSYFNVNVYIRDNPDLAGSTYQITPYWRLDVPAGKTSVIFEGFADFAGSEGASAANIIVQPRLLIDLGGLWDAPGKIEFGMEYSYWRNKYGVRGVTDSVPQVMLKIIF